jgi:hypothetical protein
MEGFKTTIFLRRGDVGANNKKHEDNQQVNHQCKAELEEKLEKEKNERELADITLHLRIMDQDISRGLEVGFCYEGNCSSIPEMHIDVEIANEQCKEDANKAENMEACGRCNINEHCENLRTNRNKKEEETPLQGGINKLNKKCKDTSDKKEAEYASPFKMKNLVAGAVAVTVAVAAVVIVRSFINR